MTLSIRHAPASLLRIAFSIPPKPSPRGRKCLAKLHTSFEQHLQDNTLLLDPRSCVFMRLHSSISQILDLPQEIRHSKHPDGLSAFADFARQYVRRSL